MTTKKEQPFTLLTHWSNLGIEIVELIGPLTSQNCGDLLQTEIESLDQVGCTAFVLDLERVPFIDSQGLGKLLKACDYITAHGGTFKLCRMNDEIKAFISSFPNDAGFYPLLESYETMAEAIHRLWRQPPSQAHS